MTRAMAAHFLADLRMLSRMPAFTIPTALLPSLFFLTFGAQRGQQGGPPPLLATSFATFAVFAVVFFKFGVGTAIERAAPWTRYVRTLPLSPGSALAARSFTAVVFALIAAAAVFITARLITGEGLRLTQLASVFVGLLGGAVPFALGGLALGYRTSPRSAVAVANVLYLMLSYAGGLWTPPDALPPGVRAVAAFLPTYHWGRVVWTGALGLPWRAADWLALAGWTVAFGALALHGYRSDQDTRYG
jgi:ABC-2 type transport system permease protein